MAVSLYRELDKLHKAGVLELKRDPSRHRPGEGAYTFKGKKISIVPNRLGPVPGNPEIILEVPHDVAWCEHTKTFLAAAPCPEEVEPEHQSDHT